VINDIFRFLTTSANWHGTEGIPTRILEHLQYSAIALAIGFVIALPIGLLIGHTGKGVGAVTGVANALRALPVMGVLILLVVWISPLIHGKGDAAYLIPSEVVLVLLAVPPILSNTYAGVQNVDPAVRDAAKGMGMTGWQVLLRVELPCALQLIIAGVRSAALQVVATATIVSFVSLGGLGRFVFDGLAQHDYPQMAAGALLLAVLAVLVDFALAGVQRYAVSRGISGRYADGRSTAPDARYGAVNAGAVEADRAAV
jgi:osmoprotectant transport system permease protein